VQIEQAFELPLPPQRVWPAFRDIDLLVQCLPGASITGGAVDGEVPMRFDVKLGPIAAGFVGAGRASFEDASHCGRFEGAASDRKTGSRIKGAADFSLSAREGGTAVAVRIDYALTGSLAQFSRGALVRELANALTARFAANLAARLQAAPAAADAAGTELPLPSGTVDRTDRTDRVDRVEQVVRVEREDQTDRSDRPGARPEPAHAAVAPLSAGSLIWSALRSWWQRVRGGRLARREP
jgi:carbon monoxide dehydrogenase subunit G